MKTSNAEPTEVEITKRLRSLLKARKPPDETLREMSQAWMTQNPGKPATAMDEEAATALLKQVGARDRMTAEEREILSNLSHKLGSTLDEFDVLVQRRFEGATRELVERHAHDVRIERTRRVVESVLQALGGDKGTLAGILEGAANAFTSPILSGASGVPVADLRKRLQKLAKDGANPTEIQDLLALLKPPGKTAEIDGAALAQIAVGLSQLLQQVSINVQKIVTVALDADRSGDTTHPKYYPPYGG
jgi:hypothetical protein